MVLPIEIPLDIIAVLLIATGVITPTIDYVFRKRVSAYVTILSLLFSLVGMLALLSLTYASEPILLYEGMLKVDFYGAFLSFLATTGALLVVLASSLPFTLNYILGTLDGGQGSFPLGYGP